MLAVPIAVIIGVPLYSNVMGMIPVVGSLIGKGLPVGTAIAFLMAVTALSLPEMVILKKVLKNELIDAFVILKQTGTEAEVIKVEDIEAILNYGVIVTPAVVINGEVKIAGKVPDEKEIRKWI